MDRGAFCGASGTLCFRLRMTLPMGFKVMLNLSSPACLEILFSLSEHTNSHPIWLGILRTSWLVIFSPGRSSGLESQSSPTCQTACVSFGRSFSYWGRSLVRRSLGLVQRNSNKIPYLFELTHRVQRPNFERVPHLKIKNTSIYVDVN